MKYELTHAHLAATAMIMRDAVGMVLFTGIALALFVGLPGVML